MKMLKVKKKDGTELEMADVEANREYAKKAGWTIEGEKAPEEVKPAKKKKEAPETDNQQ